MYIFLMLGLWLSIVVIFAVNNGDGLQGFCIMLIMAFIASFPAIIHYHTMEYLKNRSSSKANVEKVKKKNIFKRLFSFLKKLVSKKKKGKKEEENILIDETLIQWDMF